MLILRNIIATILLLTLAAISVVGIMVEAPKIWNWTPDRVNALGRSVLTIMRPDLLLFLVWVLILLGTLMVFFLTIVRPRKRMKIEVQMGGGRVVIMDAAIKKYIRNALSELGEVTIKKIDLRERRGLVTTDLIADVKTKENLPILERRIIGRVRAALAEDLGITNLGDVHVFIRNFEVSGRAITGDASNGSSHVTTEQSSEPVERKNLDLDISDREEALPPINDNSSYESPRAVSTAAASATAPLITDSLATPVETSEAAAAPIILTDADSRKEDTSASFGGDASPVVASDAAILTPASTEASASVPLILPDDTASTETHGAAPVHHDDLDGPLPWERIDAAKKKDVEEEEKDSRSL